jgi:subtilisin-like proprotein convertase family protein
VSTAVVLFTNPGGAANGGNNFCNTAFDDAATSSIQAITAAGNPYSGTFAPQNPLAGFVGQNPNGVWTFNVVDSAGVDVGSIRSFRVTITTSAPPTCSPPNNNICPTFSVGPASADKCVGESVSFSVIASGTPAPTYQWRRNSVNINTISNPSAATATLTLTGLVAGSAGTYDCIATNLCGSAPSTVATLTVGGPTCTACDSIDFNNDGLFPDDADLVDFLSVLAGSGCSTDPVPGCSDIDFNNDGLFPDDTDLIAFLTVLAGQDCPT